MKRLLSKIDQADSLHIAGKMFLFFLVVSFSSVSHHYLFALIAIVVTYAIVEPRFTNQYVFWVMISLLILPGLYLQRFIAANHTYLTFYVSILLFLAAYFKAFKKQVLYKNARLLLLIVMGFAVVQKLISKNFMNGSSLLYINNGGGFFYHFRRFFPDNQDVINANLQLISAQKKSVESLLTSIELTTPNWLFPFDATYLVWLVLGVELIFCLLLFAKNQYVRNCYFIGFMLALIIFRIETGFASLLCILLFLQAQKDNSIFKLAYVALFGLYMSMILTRLGVP